MDSWLRRTLSDVSHTYPGQQPLEMTLARRAKPRIRIFAGGGFRVYHPNGEDFIDYAYGSPAENWRQVKAFGTKGQRVFGYAAAAVRYGNQA